MITKTLTKSKPVKELTHLPALKLDAKSLANDFRRYYTYYLGRDMRGLSVHYFFKALVLTQRDRLMERRRKTRGAYKQNDSRRACYFSMEYLMGRALSNAMLNLGTEDATGKALYDLGLDLEELASGELDAGLGNGGLGRLAACFLDSCATLQLPVVGYGIRYDYGMFRQIIKDGEQVEEPDHWLQNGNPWELERPEYTQRIHYGGRSEIYADESGRLRARWVDTRDVLAVPYDIPVPGFRNNTVNTLRLWSATATEEFDLGEFNAGFYPESVAAKNDADHITMVLYPNDASENGKELRLKQHYFLASASLKDIFRRWGDQHGTDFTNFAEKNCFQLNDTHPAFAVPELMRLLLDEYGMEWDEAWNITSRTVAYTNHTLLPEALETWPVRTLKQWLPRLLDIIYEINARFLSEVARRWPGDMDRQQRMSLIADGDDPRVRMAYLAIVASFSVNGVAELHSDLLCRGLFRDFYEMWPEKFNNKTNGVTPRRWLAGCNPGLRELISREIGEGWITNLGALKKLAPKAENKKFRQSWQKVSQANKARLAALVKEQCGVDFCTHALFESHVKRFHEYKRQLLNALHIIHLYDRIKRGDTEGMIPRCILLGGKAAPGYAIAKRTIKLICNVANVINNDAEVGSLLKVAFIPDFRVTAMEVICTGTDLSVQISTAGAEASGTGNMKFMMNGALTIGTLDGANIEIRDEVGDENFFLFGLDAAQVDEERHHYDPEAYINNDADLARVMGLLESGHFNQFEPGVFDPIIEVIKAPWDHWLVAADFRSFVEAQKKVAAAFADQDNWTRMSILNTAASSKFSTDRTIGQYNEDIWKLKPTQPNS